jgi:hypothetical protein
MLIWETGAVDASRAAEIAAHATGAAECLRRDDGQGWLILCNDGVAPHGVVETRATRLVFGGDVGADAGPWVFLVGIAAPAEWREELCAWYRCEHGPILLECPHWRGFELLESTVETGCELHALHRLADRSALDSDERRRSRSTPWFARLARNAWFDGPFERVLAKRVSVVE